MKKTTRKRKKVSIDTLDFDEFDEESNIDKDDITHTDLPNLYGETKEKEVVTLNEFSLIEEQALDLNKDKSLNFKITKNKAIVISIFALMIGYIVISGSSSSYTEVPINIKSSDIIPEQTEPTNLPLLSAVTSAAALNQTNTVQIKKEEVQKELPKKRIKNTNFKKQQTNNVLWTRKTTPTNLNIENSHIENVILLSSIYSNEPNSSIKAKLYETVRTKGVGFPENTIFIGQYDGRMSQNRVNLKFYKAILPSGEPIKIEGYVEDGNKKGLLANNQYQSKVAKRSKKTLFQAAKTAISYGSGGLGQQLLQDTGRESVDFIEDNSENTNKLLVNKGIKLRLFVSVLEK